jgi:hypothetical protein
MPLGQSAGKLSKAYFPFGALTTVDINSQKVFQGVSFGATKRFSVGSSAVVDIVFDPTAVTSEYLVLLPISFKAFGAGPINIDVYFGGTYGNDGTLIPCYNRDNNSVTMCNSVLRLAPTITTVGTKLPIEFTIFSDGIPATATLGGEVNGDFVTLLRKDGKYLIRLTNTEANAAVAWMGLNWFEVDQGPE